MALNENVFLLRTYLVVVETYTTDIRYFLLILQIPAHCEIYLSSDYAERQNLLVLVASKRETPPGIWSRGLCISHGLDVGSMLPVIQAASKSGDSTLSIKCCCLRACVFKRPPNLVTVLYRSNVVVCERVCVCVCV